MRLGSEGMILHSAAVKFIMNIGCFEHGVFEFFAIFLLRSAYFLRILLSMCVKQVVVFS